MACYTIVALHSADVVVTVRKVIFVWSAQAGLDLPMVDVRIWELLPTFLTLAASSALLVEGYRVLVSKCASACTNHADMTASAAMARSAQPKREQVPVTASNNESQKHADELQPVDKKTTDIVADSAAVRSQVDSSKTPDTIKAAHSPSPNRQAVGSNRLSNGGAAMILHAQQCNLSEDGVKSTFYNAVNWDDGYLAIVRALLKRAVDEPCPAQFQLTLCLAQLLSAVPAWMLAFAEANNPGCTAYAGLEVLKSLLNGKGTKRDLQLVLGNVTKAKSMALLMRTIVAAHIVDFTAAV
ncbi:MAG: hypothetical protein FRX49_09782 [Trebouxia sp. A1-2]|nr:MAG: hypothetical protein FRX49_09782 [Trebouxia sp. A1-2]